MARAGSNLLEQCRADGRRITGPRRVIAEVISQAKDHPDAWEIHRRALKQDPTIALSTVYRTLRVFAENGLIEQHSFKGGRSRIERAAGRHHDHLIDTVTGRVVEFISPEIEKLQIVIAQRLGYELTGHRLELYGRPIVKKQNG